MDNVELYARSAPYYDLIYGPIVDYAREVDLLEDTFARHATRPIRRVLDLGCGTGSHSLILAERGYEALGLDQSEAFVAFAKQKAGRLDHPPRFVVGDMRELGELGRFDALICMFGGFGHLPRTEVGKALRGFRKGLEPGGVLAFEWWNRSGARDGHQVWEEREGEGFHLIRLGEARVEGAGQGVRVTMKHLILRGGRVEETFTEQATMTLYETGEMEALLTEAGLTPLAHLDWSYKTVEPYRDGEFRVLTVARDDG